MKPRDTSPAITNIHIAWLARIDDFPGRLLAPDHVHGSGRLDIVPSSLSRSDDRVARIRASLREYGIRTSVMLPRAPSSIVLPSSSRPGWKTARHDGFGFRIDTRLTTSPYVPIVFVSEEAKQGPFVLDLPTRFLHPVDRLKLLARPDRHRLVADIAAVALPQRSLVFTPVAGGWLTILATDVIAAELWALAIAERFLDQQLEMQGPWEDATVQRATELQLGVSVPSQITVSISGDQPLPEDARNVLQHAGTRLGIAIASR